MEIVEMNNRNEELAEFMSEQEMEHYA